MHLGKEEVAIDFVTGLPQVGEFNAICVGYRPIDENNDSYQIQLMHKEQQIYTIPKSTASTDCRNLLLLTRGTQFVNNFWARLTQRIGNHLASI